MAHLCALLVIAAVVGQALCGSSSSDRFPLTGSSGSRDSFGNSGRDSFPQSGSSSNKNQFGSSGSSGSDRDRFPSTGGRGSSNSDRDFGGSSNSFGSGSGDSWDADSDDDLFLGGGSGSSQTSSSVNRIKSWPGGVIPYEITRDISDNDFKELRYMFDSLEKWTCVKFVPHKKEANYVVIKGGNVCSAPLGMKVSSGSSLNSGSSFDRSSGSSRGNKGSSGSFNGGRDTQFTSGASNAVISNVILGKGCFTTQRVARRIMNLLGIPHEASRPDRDKYVEINFNNLRSGYSSNLKTYPASAYLPGVLDVPYDYASVTQYSDRDVAKDTKTWGIRPKDSRILANELGGNDFSSGDILKIKKAYGCSSSTGRF